MSESPSESPSRNGSPPTSSMRIGLVAETVKAETRVALTPDAVRKVAALGYDAPHSHRTFDEPAVPEPRRARRVRENRSPR